MKKSFLSENVKNTSRDFQFKNLEKPKKATFAEKCRQQPGLKSRSEVSRSESSPSKMANTSPAETKAQTQDNRTNLSNQYQVNKELESQSNVSFSNLKFWTP